MARTRSNGLKSRPEWDCAPVGAKKWADHKRSNDLCKNLDTSSSMMGDFPLSIQPVDT